MNSDEQRRTAAEERRTVGALETTMSNAFTPDEEQVREQYTQEQPPQIGSVAEKRAEFDRFVARIKADAWDEGAEHAWRSTGEGFNGEYVCGHGTHDGAISFRQVRAEDDRDDNPYREEAGL